MANPFAGLGGLGGPSNQGGLAQLLQLLQGNPSAAPASAATAAPAAPDWRESLRDKMSDPLFLMGMQMLSNLSPRVGQPINQFEGVPQMLAAAGGLYQNRKLDKQALDLAQSGASGLKSGISGLFADQPATGIAAPAASTSAADAVVTKPNPFSPAAATGDTVLPSDSGDVGAPMAATVKGRGWSDAAIAGALHNAITESSLNPGATGVAGEKGIFQFHPASHISPFTKAYGGDWSPEAQANYVADVVEKSIPGYSKLADPQQATAAFLRGFEKPADQSDRQLNARLANFSTAKSILSQFNPIGTAQAGEMPAAGVSTTSPTAGNPGAPSAPSAMGGQPSLQQVAQAQALLPSAPPPDPRQFPAGATQRAAAINMFDAGMRMIAGGGLLGDRGKGVLEMGKQATELAKGYLTEEQKKQIELRYAGPLAAIQERAKYLGPGADPNLQGQITGAQEAAKFPYASELQRQQSQNTINEKMITQSGAIIDPNNPQAGVIPVPNLNNVLAGQTGAKAQAEQAAQLAREQAMAGFNVNPRAFNSSTSAPAYGPGITEPLKTDRGTMIPPVTSAAPISGSPKQLEDMQTGKGGWNDTERSWNQVARQAGDDEQTIKTIANAFKNFETGSYKSALADIQAKAKTFGISVPISDDPAQAQLAAKQAFQKMVGSMRGIDSNPTGWELRAKVDNWVSTDSQPETNHEMLSQSLAALRQTSDLARDWKIAKSKGWADPEDFAQKWARMPGNTRDDYLARARQEIGPFKGMQGAQAQTPASSATATSGPVRVNSPAEAARLPSGTQFIDPNGQMRVRP